MVLVQMAEDQMDTAGAVFLQLSAKGIDSCACVDNEQFVVPWMGLQSEAGGLSPVPHRVRRGHRKGAPCAPTCDSHGFLVVRKWLDGFQSLDKTGTGQYSAFRIEAGLWRLFAAHCPGPCQAVENLPLADSCNTFNLLPADKCSATLNFLVPFLGVFERFALYRFFSSQFVLWRPKRSRNVYKRQALLVSR